ncbi:unnamed protein product [Effrenium voratum]|nr:unnamed protein product [Effrenium voratum]CAJ1452328.1 unnamed protein product [Effrenium voratum]|mmetsp:Transcript_55441/g.132474  ORF Transcript_55441/g.132474 Transcript_55441/m.132474 type:complete len:158 (+) Transcript_55441:78-551(+)
MTAAGQAMVVLVPLRPQSAMTFINDKDAELMGMVDEEKERLAEVDQNLKKEQQIKAADLAELRAARKELRKGAIGRREVLAKSAAASKPERGAPSIPSFMKVKSAKTTASPTGDQDAEEPEEKRPRLEEPAPASGGLGGLGGYASDSDEEEGSEDAA